MLIADAPQAATLLLADKGERFRRHWTAPMLPTIWLATVVGFAALEGRPLRMLGLGLMVAGTLVTFLLDSNLPGGGDYDPADTAWSERAEQDAYLVQRVPSGASLVASQAVLSGRWPTARSCTSSRRATWASSGHPSAGSQAYLFDLTNDGTRDRARPQAESAAGQSTVRHLAGRP